MADPVEVPSEAPVDVPVLQPVVKLVTEVVVAPAIEVVAAVPAVAEVVADLVDKPPASESPGAKVRRLLNAVSVNAVSSEALAELHAAAAEL
jgi:hypothetical protein